VRLGRPILGALYAPVTDEFFLAVAGGGATRNAMPIKATSGDAIAGARFSATKRRLEVLSAIEPRIQEVPRVPSLALRIARVAMGSLDATMTAPNSHDWDLAAADLLVHEAGGRLTTLRGETLVYNRPVPVHGALVAAGERRHRLLLEVIRDRIAELA
jgi:myo-inositol-1(or 4)-monophosphatase